MREWPAHVPEHWLLHEGGSRVLSCWGWYLVDPDDAGWRAYYLRELRSHLSGSSSKAVSTCGATHAVSS